MPNPINPPDMGPPERGTDAMREDISLSAWKALYQTAILEMDTGMVMQRIAEAEQAIVERALALRKEPPSDHAKELGALAYSANFLAELRRLETTRHAGPSSADATR